MQSTAKNDDSDVVHRGVTLTKTSRGTIAGGGTPRSLVEWRGRVTKGGNSYPVKADSLSDAKKKVDEILGPEDE